MKNPILYMILFFQFLQMVRSKGLGSILAQSSKRKSELTSEAFLRMVKIQMTRNCSSSQKENEQAVASNFEAYLVMVEGE